MSKLRYARGGPDLTNEQRTWAQRHPLYMLGDVVMVYVNEGDLYQCGEEVTGEFVKATGCDDHESLTLPTPLNDLGEKR